MPHRVKFTFKPGIPTRDLPADVGGLPVMSKARLRGQQALDLEESSLVPFLGSGAYVLDRMEVGQTLVYRRNPDYWGARSADQPGHQQFRHASASNITPITTPRSRRSRPAAIPSATKPRRYPGPRAMISRQ